MTEVYDDPFRDPSWQMRIVLHGLAAMHGWRGWHWDAETNPFEVAVGAILVQNTAWANVEHALTRLRAAGALDPAAMSALDQDALEELVRPSGQYRQKALKLRAFLALVAEHGGLDALLALPPAELRAKLLATWGIGEETADVIVLYAAGKPSFVIDAYTRRLWERLGVGPAPDASYAEWQRYFERVLEKDAELYGQFHALIVQHAKYLCRKQAPQCHRCVLHFRCELGQEVVTARRAAMGRAEQPRPTP